MELSSSNIKKFLIFSQKKAFLIFQETETPKKFLIFSQKKAVLTFTETETLKIFLMFQETELSYISGNGNLKNFLYFRK